MMCALTSISKPSLLSFFFFFFNDTAPTEIYTLSLHDALPIFECLLVARLAGPDDGVSEQRWEALMHPGQKLKPGDRKSTRLNSSHRCISYAVFCLKKKKNKKEIRKAIARRKIDDIIDPSDYGL